MEQVRRPQRALAEETASLGLTQRHLGASALNLPVVSRACAPSQLSAASSVLRGVSSLTAARSTLDGCRGSWGLCFWVLHDVLSDFMLFDIPPSAAGSRVISRPACPLNMTHVSRCLLSLLCWVSLGILNGVSPEPICFHPPPAALLISQRLQASLSGFNPLSYPRPVHP